VANTDKKEGFTKIPNDILDAIIRQKLSATQERALLYIIRKTYGYNKDDDRISIKRMAEETGYSRRAMIGAVHDLYKMGIVQMGSIRSGTPTYMSVRSPSFWDCNLDCDL